VGSYTLLKDGAGIALHVRQGETLILGVFSLHNRSRSELLHLIYSLRKAYLE
jgi:ABC-type sugar transport system ATPase subunit